MTDSYLVIGGNGLLGGHIVDKLLERGEKAVSVFDLVQVNVDPRVRFFAGDVSDYAVVKQAVQESGATCIFHTAALLQGKSKEHLFKVNVGGTENVVNAARACGVSKLVYTGSASAVFSGHDQAGVDERCPYPETAFDDYNETKALSEEIVLSRKNKEYGLSTTVLRVAALFGPRDRLIVPSMMQVMVDKRTHIQIGNNKNLFDFTYVENAAYAHLLAADRLSVNHPNHKLVAGEAFFITNGEPWPYWDFPRALWRAAGHTPSKITVIPKWLALVIAVFIEIIAWLRGVEATLSRFRVHYICLTRYCNIDKARRALGYHPLISLDEGIKRSAEYWIKTHPKEAASLLTLRSKKL